MNPYIKLQNRKRTWTPVQPTKGVLKEGAEETIKRALAIRHMAVSYTHLTLPTILRV